MADPNRVSPTCAAVCGLLQAASQAITRSLDGTNLTLVLEELGLRLFDLLLKHCARTRVGAGAGAIQLLRDLTEYRDAARRCGPPDAADGGDVVEKFETLREVSNLHLVATENLRDVWRESRLASLSVDTVASLVAMRSDVRDANAARKLVK